MDEVAVLRAVHVAAAVLLLGNVTVTGFWAAYLYRRRATVPFRQVARAILWSDLAFTLGGGTALVVSGILLVRARGLHWGEEGWLRQGVGALALSTSAWLLVLLPDQLRMERRAAVDEAKLRRVFVRWSVVGWLATVALYAGLWVMVTRP
ncbi:MAG TPA: DUF2269 family protein [Gemmatimonadales bacterium]|jgi:uncharacterized membrane protein|nr:DUF2269 family protein [Gemmatimonadales bacterium]